MAKKFVHLHLHTEYSLLDGLSKIGDLMTHIKEHDMDTVAITDHGSMFGVVEFYKKAKKEEVKPILGMETYITDIDMKSRPERGKFQNFHLLLLAKNEEGYKNLMKLTSLAHLEGYYYRPRVDHETLAKYSKGIICTSACAQGEVAQALIEGDNKKAKEKTKWYQDVFGEDFYLEVQRHEYEKHVKVATNAEIKAELTKMAENEKIINNGVVKLSKDLGIPIVATNDAHYIKKDDAPVQDALVCIATGKNVSDIKRLRFIDTPSFYVNSPEEMETLFPDIPEALENTRKVADKCNVDITLDKWFFPVYKLDSKKTAIEEMEERVWSGIKDRVHEVTTEIEERLRYEIGIIKEKGYATYFLIVSDMAKWAAENGIVTNTRGSAAGSLVSYAMGIINLNPLDYGLPFERFLTPWRPTPPDIDFDIADDRRDDVIRYLVDKYGQDKVAQICTFGRMMAKAGVRDIARVLGYPYSTGDRIAKAIPLGSQGFPMSINKALEISPELSSMYENDAEAKKVIDLARGVEGNARHVSVHAAGVVIAPTELTDFTPILKEGDRVITQYDMEALDPNVSPGEAVGLLKFDLLGLRNLSILGAAIKIIKEVRGEEIDLLSLPLTDKKTFELLSRGETMGVFQLSSSGMTKWIKELKPTRIEDIMAMVALYRPGPMQFIPDYIERKKDPGSVKYIDPRMKEFMGMSYGLMIYQEDCLLTAINIAGYSWEEADKFRKAIGKKIPAEMAKQHDKFVHGCVDNGLAEKKAEDLFSMIEKFAAYGFNKGHSASYGRVAYWTAHLKANYPVEYMTALLTAESGDTEKISAAINECRHMGIKVLPPDINESGIGFTITKDSDSLNGQGVRFGLSAIKNVGEAAIEAILEERDKQKFLSFGDFLARVDGRRVNKKVLESLIKVGALSAFGGRSALLSSLDELRSKIKPKNESQQGLFGVEDVEAASPVDNFSLVDVAEFSEEELQLLERQLLGFSLSAKPIHEMIGSLVEFATHKTNEVSQDTIIAGKVVKVAGVVSSVRTVVTKKSAQEMAFVKLEDDKGTIDLVVFPKLYASTKAFWVDNKALLVSGKVDFREESPSLLVDSIQTQTDISAIGQGQETLYVKIPKGTSDTHLIALKELFLSYPGTQQVSLVFEGSDEKLTLPFTISWSERLSRLIAQVIAGDPYSGVE